MSESVKYVVMLLYFVNAFERVNLIKKSECQEYAPGFLAGSFEFSPDSCRLYFYNVTRLELSQVSYKDAYLGTSLTF